MNSIDRKAREEFEGWVRTSKSFPSGALEMDSGAYEDTYTMFAFMGYRRGLESGAAEVARLSAALADRRAQLEEERGRNAWQPMGIAPKDGTWIFAYRPVSAVGRSDTLLIVRWLPGEFDWPDGWAWPSTSYDVTTKAGLAHANGCLAEGECYLDDAFTHWRPLSAPPLAIIPGESQA